MTRFTANVGFLFTELPFLDRFDAVRRAGFDAVEFAWPTVPLPDLRAAIAECGLGVGQMNMDAGDLDAGDRGWASHPDAVDRWRDAFAEALELARDLACPLMNVLAGNVQPGVSRARHDRCLRDNLRWALSRAAGAGRRLLIEVLNAHDTPAYLLTDTRAAAALLSELADPWLRLQFDTYHVAHAEDPVARFGELAPMVGHVQVADFPGRGEPGSGRIDFPCFFEALADAGYRGAVGLEYRPRGDTEASLAWLPRDARRWQEEPFLPA